MSNRHHRFEQPIAGGRPPQAKFEMPIEPPLAELPERMLTAEEQRQHAKTFFDYFSTAMRNRNNPAEVGCFDLPRFVDTMLADKLLPEEWRQHRHQVVNDVSRILPQTHMHQGANWDAYSVKVVKQARQGELIVATQHLHQASGIPLHFRWWLAHRDGRWRIHEVESVDYGIRFSMLIATTVSAPNVQVPLVPRDLVVVRHAVNSIMMQANFAEGERSLNEVRVEGLPNSSAAAHHMLMAQTRVSQKRWEEVLVLCDAAQRRQPDLPGCDFLRALAYNSLRRGEPALKHARLAEEWLGDDFVVNYQIGMNQRNNGPELLLVLALASTGDAQRVLDFLDIKKPLNQVIEDCYSDEDLGPLLRGTAFRAVQERYPPPVRKLPE